MISFVPFMIVLIWLAGRVHADISFLTEGVISIVPSGLKAYVISILEEVNGTARSFVPVSFLLLIWSASKFFHAVTNGLNAVSRVHETRGWFYLRFRSMFFVILFFLFTGAALLISLFGRNIRTALIGLLPGIADLLRFFDKFQSLFGYFGLILLFLFLYKFLPNCYYTFRSQFPGALIVSTVWMFFSYLMSIYYDHNQNFAEIYGSMTSMILAMIWLFLCCYFLMFGALINRVIYEDPEDNVFVNTVDVVKDASERRRLEIERELKAHSVMTDGEEKTEADRAYADLKIPWYDEMRDRLDKEGAAAGDESSQRRNDAAL